MKHMYCGAVTSERTGGAMQTRTKYCGGGRRTQMLLVGMSKADSRESHSPHIRNRTRRNCGTTLRNNEERATVVRIRAHEMAVELCAT